MGRNAPGEALRSVAELVEELLRFNGFLVRREERFLSASKGSIRVLVRIEGERETIDGSYIEEVRRAAEGRGADRILLVHTGDVAEGARSLLERYRVVLWDRERLSVELGRALLASAEGELAGPELPFGDYELAGGPRADISEGWPEAAGAEGGEASMSSDAPTGAGAADAGTGPGQARRVAVAAGQSDILEFLRSDARAPVAQQGTDRYIEVRLSPGEAQARAPRLHGAARCDLQFIPYHMFDYQVELEDDVGALVVRNNGTLAVNALTGQAQEWNQSPAMRASPPADRAASVLRPSIDAMAAYEQANRAVKDLHTRVVEKVEERGTVTVFQKLHVKPRDGAIELRSRGTIYLPVWCIEAPQGVAVVNANTGRIVKEEYLD
jgi:hypothetical protein